MALVLKLKKGTGFQVGPHRFVVHRIISATEVILRHASGLYVRVNGRLAKIAEGIWMRSGTEGQLTLAQICIDADREAFPISRN